MTGNSSIFSTFQSQTSTSTATLAYGSQSCVLRAGTIITTPSLPLSYVISLLNFSFNLMYVSKVTRALKCYISFFLDFCLFQNLMTKQIIGGRHEYGGLYILDHVIPRLVACSRVTTPFETPCRLGHPSLPLKCIFFGHSRVQKGYRCYCPSLRRYLVSIDATFLKNVPFSSPLTPTS